MRIALADHLATLLDGERRAQVALAVAAAAVSDPLLRAAIDEQRELGGEQVARLLRACALIGAPGLPLPGALAMAACDEIAARARDPDGEMRDARLIAALQALIHIEIAGYLAAGAWARRLELPAVAEMLERSQAEEETIADRLAAFAEHIGVE